MSKVLCKKEKEYGHTIYLIADEPYREIVYDGLNVPYIRNIIMTHLYVILTANPCLYRVSALVISSCRMRWQIPNV